MTDRLRVGACLSLSGRFSQFGRQAALGLQAWRSLHGDAELVLEDDRSDRQVLEAVLPDVAARCDVLLGPYSTVLMRAAGRIAADRGRLLWNHGGSGGDAEQEDPGHVVSVLTPARRYGEPFIRHLANEGGQRDLCIVHGPGRFGRQVADGAAEAARKSGIHVVRAEPGRFPPAGLSRDWDLFSAGVFEQDAELTAKALGLPVLPRRLCTVSAGVREFVRVVSSPEGVLGIAQWFPGRRREVLLGPREHEFLNAYVTIAGTMPDYPAVQAAAGATIATHCANVAESTRRKDLWAVAANLDTSTMFGSFKIDPVTGSQVKHETVLVQWRDGEPQAVQRRQV